MEGGRFTKKLGIIDDKVCTLLSQTSTNFQPLVQNKKKKESKQQVPETFKSLNHCGGKKIQ